MKFNSDKKALNNIDLVKKYIHLVSVTFIQSVEYV